jgi:hypothetical protein
VDVCLVIVVFSHVEGSASSCSLILRNRTKSGVHSKSYPSRGFLQQQLCYVNSCKRCGSRVYASCFPCVQGCQIDSGMQSQAILEKSQTNFNIFFILTSHEKLQIHVITIIPTGMSGTYGINLVRYEVL